jgi:hypothetical protein
MIKDDTFLAFRKSTGKPVCDGRIFTCMGLVDDDGVKYYDAYIKHHPLPVADNCKPRAYQLFTRFFRFDIVQYASRRNK